MWKPETVTEQRSEDEIFAAAMTMGQRYIAPTVEECHAIEVKMFRTGREKHWSSGGELTWVGQRSGRVSLVTRFRVIGIPGAERVRNILDNPDDGPILVLTASGPAQTIRIRVCVGGFGGKRYFFVCPSCERTYRKLFLPPGKLEFACRRCHKLRYESQRRDLDFFLKPIAVKTGTTRRLVRKYLGEIRAMADREALLQLEHWNEQPPDQTDLGGME